MPGRVGSKWEEKFFRKVASEEGMTVRRNYGWPIIGEMPAVTLRESCLYGAYEAGSVSACSKYSTCILEASVTTSYLPCT